MKPNSMYYIFQFNGIIYILVYTQHMYLIRVFLYVYYLNYVDNFNLYKIDYVTDVIDCNKDLIYYVYGIWNTICRMIVVRLPMSAFMYSVAYF